MPYKRKDSPIWWISYQGPDGQRIRRSAGTADRKEAEALEARAKLDSHRTKTWGEEPERPIEALMLDYLQAHRDKRSAARDVEIARTLRAFFGGRDCRHLAAPDIRGYIELRKAADRAATTIRRELALLSAMLNWARNEKDWRIPNPVPGRRLPTPEGRLRWLTPEDADRLIEAAEAGRAGHLPDFIRLALHTGMRKGELLRLDWTRVDLRAGVIRLEAQHTKTARRRIVPLNQTARAALLSRARHRAEHCPASPWVFCDEDGNRLANVRKGFEMACQRAGIQDFRIHDLRHTCAAWLVTAGAPLAEVRDLLGHQSVVMTERYAHLAPENLRSTVARLDARPDLAQSSHGHKKSG